MVDADTRDTRIAGGRLHIPRSRGALSGLLLVLLGIWGAIIPFVGPYFDFAYSPDTTWTWTDPRGWLEVLPGAATFIGGLLLLGARDRLTATVGGWLTVAAGAWFVIGTPLASTTGLGDIGTPIASSDSKAAALQIALFTGLGAVIMFLGGTALGRIWVRGVGDAPMVVRHSVAGDAQTGRHGSAAASPQQPPYTGGGGSVRPQHG